MERWYGQTSRVSGSSQQRNTEGGVALFSRSLQWLSTELWENLTVDCGWIITQRSWPLRSLKIPFIPFPKGEPGKLQLVNSIYQGCKEQKVNGTLLLSGTFYIYFFSLNLHKPFSGLLTISIPSWQMRKRRPRGANNLPRSYNLGWDAEKL